MIPAHQTLLSVVKLLLLQLLDLAIGDFCFFNVLGHISGLGSEREPPHSEATL